MNPVHSYNTWASTEPHSHSKNVHMIVGAERVKLPYKRACWENFEIWVIHDKNGRNTWSEWIRTHWFGIQFRFNKHVKQISSLLLVQRVKFRIFPNFLNLNTGWIFLCLPNLSQSLLPEKPYTFLSFYLHKLSRVNRVQYTGNRFRTRYSVVQSIKIHCK